MPIDVTIRYSGPGTLPALRVRDPNGRYHKITLSGGKATFVAAEDREYGLFWAVVGPAGVEYTITLSAPSGAKVIAKENPLKRPVPSNEFGFGRMKFTAAREKKNAET